ncbi:MAG: DUF362 domain-containing protein [Bacillota bacterium]|nr:DUF362 domain-containing protein [Bacillota bacterium]
MKKVLIVDSNYENCIEAVREVFAQFPSNLRGKKVAVKVNAIKAGDPDKDAFTTNYNFVKAVISHLETLGPSSIVVGDSVGTESYGNSDDVFTRARLKEAAGPYYKNFNQNLELVELGRPLKRKVAVLKDILDADFYISLPKLKTHGLTLLSGGMKNNFGLLTGAQKSWYHYYSKTPEAFASIVTEMFRLRPPDLVVMDAVLAMEGYGPASPETRWVKKVIASDDAVALDTVAAKIVGFTVEEVPTLSQARDLSLGETFLENIEIIGEAPTIQEYHRPTPPELSYSYKAGVGSGRTSIEFYRVRVAMRPVFDPEKCQAGCTICVDNCLFKALSRDEGLPEINPALCMLCSGCKEICPYDAVQLLPDDTIVKELEIKEKDWM